MTWFELAREILKMPFPEMMKPVKVFDYNEKTNENGDAVTAVGIESWDLDVPEDFMIIFNSKGVYTNVS